MVCSLMFVRSNVQHVEIDDLPVSDMVVKIETQDFATPIIASYFVSVGKTKSDGREPYA